MSDSDINIKRRIDMICDEFDRAWRDGEKPNLVDFLKRVGEENRDQLLDQLLPIDLEYRSKSGQTITAGIYLSVGSDVVEKARAVIDKMAASSFDETMSPSTTVQPNTKLNRQIGPYKLLQQIGEGGMGTVWMAQQTKPVRRRVALKVIKGGMASPQVIARFEAERQALTMMDHQCIARVLDAGETDDGNPYFVMELVQGTPITEYCDKHKVPVPDRLGLMVDVCKAIQHAHQKGIIHRDLKPSNVLVTLYEGRPVPKVIDFGLAKALEQTTQLTDKTMFTEFGQVVGTVQYMAPEQAEMNSNDIDTRTDVYALGVLMYELLTGSTPLDKQTIGGNALLQILEIIREKEPPRPSSRLSSTKAEAATLISEQRKIAPARLQGILRGELDWVIMKALEKDRARRYESASAFAEDIQRYLDDEPVQARPPSLRYRLGKSFRRHRVAVVVSAAMLLLLVAAVIGTTSGWLRANRLAKSESAAKQEAIDKKYEADQQRDKADRLAASEVAAKNALADEKENAVADLYATTIALAQQEWLANNVERAEQLLNECPEPYRHWEWRYLKSLCNPALHTLRGHAGLIEKVVWNNDGRQWITSGRDSTVRVWDASTGRQTKQIFVGSRDSVALATGGDVFCVARGSDLEIWNLDQGEIVSRFVAPEPASLITGMVISPDTSQAAISWMTTDREALEADDTKSKVWIVNLKTGKWEQSFEAAKAPYLNMAFSPDGSQLAIAQEEVVVRDLQTGEQTTLQRDHVRPVTDLEFSPDGKQVAACSADGTAGIFAVDTGARVVALRGHEGQVYSITFSADGAQVATGANDRTVRVWNARSGALMLMLRGNPEAVTAVSWSPNGDEIAATSINTAQVFEVKDLQRLQKLVPQDEVPETSRGDEALASFDAGSQLVNYYSRHFGQGYQTSIGNKLRPMQAVAFSHDGLMAASIDLTGVVSLWETATGIQLHQFDEPESLGFAVAFSPDGKLLAASGGDKFGDKDGIAPQGHVRVWEVESRKEKFSLRGHGGFVTGLAFSPDGKRLASSSGVPAETKGLIQTLARVFGDFKDFENDIRIWSMVDGQQLAEFGTQTVATRCLAFDQQGERLVSGGEDGKIHLWDSRNGQAIRNWQPTWAGFATGIEFSPGVDEIAAASSDHTIRIFDAQSGKERRKLDGHSADVLDLVYSSDGERLFSVSRDSTIKVWNPASGSELLTLRGHTNLVTGIAISPDDQHLASISHDGTLKMWKSSTQDAAWTDSESWPVVFSDEFDQGKLASRWVPAAGSWSSEDGSLKAKLAKTVVSGRTFHQAGMHVENLLLPEVFELRLDVLTQAENGVQVLFINDQVEGEIVELLSARNPYNGTSGATLYEQNGLFIYNILTANREWRLPSDRVIQLLIRRTPKHLFVAVNGEEFCSADVSAIPDVGLAINALYGPDESEVFFDNLEIRAPQSAITKRDARQLVHILFDEVLLKSEVRRRIELESGISPEVRRLALSFAETLEHDGSTLINAAQQTATTPGLSADAYLLALQQAEMALEFRPGHPPWMKTLGMAQYRAGKFDDALRTMTQTSVQIAERLGYSDPVLLAYMAMAYGKKGDQQTAQKMLARVQDMTLSDFWNDQQEMRKALEEAKSVITSSTIDGTQATELAAIKQAGFGPHQAGWYRHDLESYMSVWTDNAREIYCRTETPDAYDVVLDRQKLADTRRLGFQGKPKSNQFFTVDQVRVDVDGELANLQGDITIVFEEGSGFMTFRQKIQLRKEEKEWKISERRTWLIRRKMGGETVTLDDATYETLDREVAELKEQADLETLLLRQQDAGHRIAAWETSKKLTAQENATGEEWLRRADLAFYAGDAVDMVQSMQAALDLGYQNEGPNYYRAFVFAKLGRSPVQEFEHGVKFSVPEGWDSGNARDFTCPGDFIAAWWLGKPKSVLIFRMRGQSTATQIADNQETTQTNMGRTIVTKEIISIDKKEASSVSYTGPGNGFRMDGKGDVMTTQRLVTIPRQSDIIMIVMTAPSDEFAEINRQADLIFETLQLGDR